MINKEWITPCHKCKKELHTVEVSTISIGSRIIYLCKECAHRVDELKPSLENWQHWLTGSID